MTVVTVHREHNLLHAHIVCNLLRSEGVAASLHGGHHVGIDFRQALALGGVCVQVPRAQLAQAQQVLGQWHKGAFEAALESEHQLPPDLCPHCGARHWRYTRWRYRSPWRTLAVALLVLYGLGLFLCLPPPITGRRCCRCGHGHAFDGDNGGSTSPEHRP